VKAMSIVVSENSPVIGLAKAEIDVCEVVPDDLALRVDPDFFANLPCLARRRSDRHCIVGRLTQFGAGLFGYLLRHNSS